MAENESLAQRYTVVLEERKHFLIPTSYPRLVPQEP